MPDGSAPDGAHREAHSDWITKRQTGETPDATASYTVVFSQASSDVAGNDIPGFRHTEATRGTLLAERGWVA